MPVNSTTIMAYPCISSLQIGTNQLMNFNINSNYRSDITTLVTTISVFNQTYINKISLKVILFNIIQSNTVNSYYTYYGSQSYVTQNFNSGVDFNANVTHYDSDYFFPFVGFYGIYVDLSNISVSTVGGLTEKHFWM
jgi:hypothetical protein